MYRLVSEWKNEVFHEIIQYRYNYSWDNVVKYETINGKVFRRVYGLTKPIGHLNNEYPCKEAE